MSYREQIAYLPLTHVRDRDINNLNVSRRSRWGDSRWILDATTPNQGNYQLTVRWDFEIRVPGGYSTVFTESQWDTTRNSMKRFIWTLRTDPPAGRTRFASTTIVSHAHNLRTLLRWLVSQGYQSFDALDPDLADDFISHLISSGKTRKATAPYANTLILLWLQRDKYPDSPRHDPFRGRRGKEIIDDLEPTTKIPYTPDEIAIPLVSSALRLIEKPGEGTRAPADDVIDLFHGALEIHLNADTKDKSIERRKKFHRSFNFTTLPGETRPWFEGNKPTDLGFLTSRIVDACYIIISFLCGPRHSEIAGFTTGCIEKDVHTSEDGLENYSYIRGTIFKTGRPQHRWVAPDPAVRAVEVMERLFEPIRRTQNIDNLFITSGQTSPINGSHIKWSVISSASLLRRINNWFFPFINLPEYNGKTWYYTTHQGRKTFAMMIARRDKSNLAALQQQFGHTTRVMTDRGYVGNDIELNKDVLLELQRQSQDILLDLWSRNKLGGRLGKHIVEHNPVFNGRISQKDLPAYVKQVIENGEIVLGVCEWGVCIYRKDKALCHGDDNGTNEIFRSAMTCAACPNLVVTEGHRPVYENILEDATTVLEHSEIDSQTRKICEDRSCKCTRILNALDGMTDTQPQYQGGTRAG